MVNQRSGSSGEESRAVCAALVSHSTKTHVQEECLALPLIAKSQLRDSTGFAPGPTGAPGVFISNTLEKR